MLHGFWFDDAGVQCGATRVRHLCDIRGSNWIVYWSGLKKTKISRSAWNSSQPKKTIWYGCKKYGCGAARKLAIRHLRRQDDTSTLWYTDILLFLDAFTKVRKAIVAQFLRRRRMSLDLAQGILR